MSHDWRDCRVLVTGGRGFIASHLQRRLLAEGARVHAVSRTAFTGGDTRVTWSQVDLADSAALRRLVADVRPDVLFHLAGHVVGSQELAQVEPAFHLNLASTVYLLTAAVETGHCRVVLAGSMQEPDPRVPNPVPPSPYGASKWACAGYARMFHALYQLPIVIARPFMVYGPAQWDLKKLLPYVITSLLKGEAPRVSSGARELDWVYVDDVADGLMLVARSPHMDGRTIDLGSGQLISIRDLIDRLVDMMRSNVRPVYGAVADRPLERPHAANVDETRRLIGWTATTTLDAGLRATVPWYDELLTGAGSAEGRR